MGNLHNKETLENLRYEHLVNITLNKLNILENPLPFT